MKTYTTKVVKNGTVLYYDAKTGKRLAKETALANERNYIINNGTVEERYKLAQEYYRGTDDGRIEKFGKHSTYISSRGRATTRTNWHRIDDIAADVELSRHYNLTVDEFKAQFAAANKTSVEEPKEETAPVAEPAAEPAVEETAESLPESPNNDGDELIDAPEVKAPVDDLKEDYVMETMDEIRDMLNDAIYGDYDENSERYKALLDTLSGLGISVDTDKLKDFAAAVEYYAETGTEKVLETAAETVNAGHWGYKFYPDVDTYDEVGEAVFYENTKDCRDLPDWFVNYFDCEQLGEDMERYDGGKFTRYGFFMPLG